MAIITIGNTKGGVGKSAVAVQLAAALAAAGHRVKVFDADTKQHTAEIALGQREANGYPPIAVSSYKDGKSLLTQVRLMAPEYDYSIIDVGGRDSGGLRAALGDTDLLVIPFSPGSFELWAYDDMFTVVQEMLPLNEFKIMPFLNKAWPVNMEASNAEIVAQVEAYGVRVYPERMQLRIAVDRASARGIPVGSLKPVDSKADEEVAAIVRAILDTLAGTYTFKEPQVDVKDHQDDGKSHQDDVAQM